MKKTNRNTPNGAANGKNRPKTYYIYALAICAAAIAALAISISGCSDNSPSGNQSDELDIFLNKFSKDPSGPPNNGGDTFYKLTVVPIPADGGSVSGSNDQANYKPGAQVTVTATPKDGYTFNGWLGDIESKDPSVTINMDGNKTLYANFQPKGTTQTRSTIILFDINDATGNTPAQIKVSYGNSTPLPEPEGVSKPGHRFAGWNTSRDGEGTDYGYGAGASYTFTDEVVILYAMWTLNEYSVIWNTNGGVPAPTQTSVTHGGDINAPAETMTKTGYRFDGWYTNEALSGTAAAFPINNVTNDRTFYAKWTLNTYTVTFNAGANGTLSATVDGTSISSGATVQHGKNVIFTATPTAGSGYGVNVWTRDGNTVAAGDAAYILENISAATTVSVSFVKLTVDKFTVAFNTQDGGATTVSPQSVELNGKAVKPTDPTRTGYTFGGWYKEAACTNPWYFETDVVTGTTTLYAKWTINTYTLTTTANPSGGGSFSRSPNQTSSNYDYGTNVQVTATAAAGYTFTGWSGDASGIANSVTIMMNSNKAVTANFQAIVTVSSTGTGASGGGNYATGATVTIIAGTAPVDYRFKNWTTTSSGVTFANANSATTTFSMPTNPVTVTANFETVYVSDSRDSKNYRTVRIGDQTWMAENLNYATSSGSWCYWDEPESCYKYGRLYDWAAAMNIKSSYNSSTFGGSDVKYQGICPNGWHLPSWAEWTTLVNYAGGSSTAGTKLKSTSGWYASSGVPAGADSYGFSALPGGYRYSGNGGLFGSVSIGGIWWAATEIGAGTAYRGGMGCDTEGVGVAYHYKSDGFSVRCVLDD